MGVAITESVAVDGPRLSTAPNGFIGITLCSLSASYLTGSGSIINDMVATSICFELLFQSSISMRYSNFVEYGITRKSGGFEK